jgi:hypothetical protein
MWRDTFLHVLWFQNMKQLLSGRPSVSTSRFPSFPVAISTTLKFLQPYHCYYYYCCCQYCWYYYYY